MRKILRRLKNPSTIIAITSSIVVIITNLDIGINIDNEAIDLIIDSICTIGIAIGILNNPSTDGIDNLFEDEKEDKKNE